jgi:hypothetical protein
MPRTLSNKELKNLLGGFESQGCRVEKISDGYKIFPPEGGRILTLHLTLSDHRGMLNFKSQAKRLGLNWPLDRKKK